MIAQRSISTRNTLVVWLRSHQNSSRKSMASPTCSGVGAVKTMISTRGETVKRDNPQNKSHLIV